MEGRLMWDRLSAEERAKRLRPRDDPPRFVAVRLIFFCLASWIVAVGAIYVSIVSALWIGRVLFLTLVRIDPTYGHDPLAFAFGTGAIYFCTIAVWKASAQVYALDLGSVRWRPMLESFAVLFSGFLALPLICGCFIAWSASQKIGMPTHEDWALGFVIQLSTMRFAELADHFPNAADSSEVIMGIMYRPELIFSLLAPSVGWVCNWATHSAAWILLCRPLDLGTGWLFRTSDDRAATDNADDGDVVSEAPVSSLLVVCALALRLGLISSTLHWAKAKFGSELAAFVKKAHRALHRQRYCIGWRLHDHEMHSPKRETMPARGTSVEKPPRTDA